MVLGRGGRRAGTSAVPPVAAARSRPAALTGSGRSAAAALPQSPGLARGRAQAEAETDRATDAGRRMRASRRQPVLTPKPGPRRGQTGRAAATQAPARGRTLEKSTLGGLPAIRPGLGWLAQRARTSAAAAPRRPSDRDRRGHDRAPRTLPENSDHRGRTEAFGSDSKRHNLFQISPFVGKSLVLQELQTRLLCHY